MAVAEENGDGMEMIIHGCQKIFMEVLEEVQLEGKVTQRMVILNQEQVELKQLVECAIIQHLLQAIQN